MIRSNIAKNHAYELSLHSAVAQSQGEIGYVLQQCLENKLKKNKIRKNVTTVLTQVIVDKNDKAFRNPTKPIGPFYNEKQAKQLGKKFVIKKDVHGGYRRVVASPQPKEIVESHVIKKFVKQGVIVIACGGGGIPVVRNKGLQGIDAVIDKDLASAVLAKNLKADVLIMLTDISKVALNYGKSNQKWLRKMTLSQAKKYMKQGQFPAGSMGPKIQAAINFLSVSGKKVIITSSENIEKALAGKDGTVITR